MHVLRSFGERNVYFLNKCIIRVFYRFNRSRALQYLCDNCVIVIDGDEV